MWCAKLSTSNYCYYVLLSSWKSCLTRVLYQCHIIVIALRWTQLAFNFVMIHEPFSFFSSFQYYVLCAVHSNFAVTHAVDLIYVWEIIMVHSDGTENNPKINYVPARNLLNYLLQCLTFIKNYQFFDNK